ncbi:filamentous hemagglutinin N-terminal domain-containing protein [Oscillatoria sp. FACHB-1406]|uniref:two-partner secretion domain-containing protein n=1 Tax=Oscillatoria sp. FACHB-1406 TaxID=2692846 RepID=UPI001685F464|nr:filamentous hemagglutinin N-terminal domain-containing protein [Oscillatoria sp. FACHB-1406]MBD2579931.1 filamentous hemagglutinin N-terminal domain-containing protein [Oscillatoria sp. FACHB-1406]
MLTRFRGYLVRERGVVLLKGCAKQCALTILGACFFWGQSAKAQIIPDATLPNNSTVIPLGPINIINGGTRAGNNLFHSFSEFSLPAANIASFNNASDIANIFSRVTGGNPSNLNGIIFTNGNANLFFINPNGIIFGPNTTLSVGGSFVATTANAIGFGNRGNFNATVPNDPSLLTIQPSFFQYDRAVAQPANSIEVRGQLSVNSGKSILLVGGGGSILVDGTINSDPNNGFISAPSGKIEIGGLSAPGTIGLATDANNPGLMSLIFPSGVEKSDVSIVNRGTLEVRGNPSGEIAISARQLNIKDSTLVSSIMNGGFPGAKAGDITLNATEITLEGSNLLNGVAPQSTGDGGDIKIAAQRLNVTGETQIFALNYGRGNAGNVAIAVGESFNANGQARNGVRNIILSGVAPGGEGNGGNVEIRAGSLKLTDGTQIVATTFGRGNAGNVEIATGTLEMSSGAGIDASTRGQGNGGNVRIAARERIDLDGEGSPGASAIGSAVLPGAVGNGGNVEIATGTLNITNGAGIIASTGGRGNAGKVTVAARDSINLDGEGSYSVSQIGSLAIAGAVGNGGDVEITTGTLNITNGSGIGATTVGRGNAGNVRVAAREGIHLAGEGSLGSSSIASQVAPGALGNGGTLDVTTPTLSLTGGAQISTSVFGQGNAGTVRVVAKDRIDLDGYGMGASGINSGVLGGVGNGGNIDLTTGTLNITNSAQILTSTIGRGNAGNVRVVASNEINLDGQRLVALGPTSSAIASSVALGAVGNGGNIDLETGTLKITNGGLVSAETFGQGNGGNITIAARGPEGNRGAGRITLDGQGCCRGAISTSVRSGGVGNGGNIDIATGTLDITNGARVTAETSGRGNAGSVRIGASHSVTLDGQGSRGASAIATSVNSGAVGNGGNIDMAMGTLDLTNGALVTASSSGQGNGGNIIVAARDRLSVNGDGSAIATSVNPGGVGDGGDISLAAPSIEITNRGLISANNLGTGDAGDIAQISARTLYLDNGSITTQSPSGNGGNIRNIQVQDLLLMRNGSQISTTAGTQQSGGGNGGNIGINAGFIVAIPRENSDITANAFAGNGGNINISTQGIFGFSIQRFLTPRSDITASSQLGFNGTINILTLGIDPNRGLVPPPLSPGAPNLPQSCQANARQGGSRFIESDRGGLPPNPQEALGSSSLWSDARSSEAMEPAADSTPKNAPAAISEAQGWVRGANGTVVFVGSAPTSSLVAIAGCQRALNSFRPL